VRKGFVPANTIYAIVLIIIFIIAVGQLFYHFLNRETTLEYFLSDIYVAKNGMNLANLYLENSLDFAVYQAMYDSGRRGGWKEIPAGSAYDENLTYWQESGGVIIPSGKDLNDSLKSAISENLNKYVQGGYLFLDKYYTLPEFEPDGIAVTDTGNATRVSAASGMKIVFHDVIEHETGEERISIESAPRMGNTYTFDYFDLYEKSTGIFRKVRSTLCDVLNEGDERTTTDGDYKYTQKVLSKASSASTCTAEVRVNVTETGQEKFPVFNGTGVSFEPVSMVFIVKIG